MRRLALCTASLLAILALSPVVRGVTPGSGIADSPHDFTEHNTDPNGTGVVNAVEIGLCTFCHTPHRAQSTRLLWNHTLSSNTFDWGDVTKTQGGTELKSFTSSWMGVSKNCLSCHDGSVAIGDVAWFNEQAWNTGTPILDHSHDQADDPARIASTTGDLAGNHPVAHPFPYGNSPSTYNGNTSGAAAVLSGWQSDPQTLGIRLFNDDGSGQVTAGAVSGKTGIECSSCHDPHNGSGVQEGFFLRGKLTGNDTSYICLKCHDK